MVSMQAETEQWLEEVGRKKKWMAEQIGVSPQRFSQWLNGRTSFTNRQLEKITLIISQH